MNLKILKSLQPLIGNLTKLGKGLLQEMMENGASADEISEMEEKLAVLQEIKQMKGLGVAAMFEDSQGNFSTKAFEDLIEEAGLLAFTNDKKKVLVDHTDIKFLSITDGKCLLMVGSKTSEGVFCAFTYENELKLVYHISKVTESVLKNYFQ